MAVVDIDAKIPNNVELSADRRLQRALESWQPKFVEWWKTLGPVAFQDKDVFLRTAVSVGQEGWAHFGHVKMPEYRWGIFLADAEADRRIAFGDNRGRPVWQDVPGEHRSELRRLIVVQGDTEPASVEQQRALCTTAPSLYDLRNLFQVNVEEGRHLWAMVYLLHRYFGRDGRDEADEMLERHSGDTDHPRILGAFNVRPRTGFHSSSSPTSPTGTASSSWHRCAKAPSTHSHGHAISCSRRRPTTCSSALLGSAGSCSGPSN